MADTKNQQRTLQVLDIQPDHKFQVPSKRINDGEDVNFFLTSRAYSDIMTFLFQLNAAMFPQKVQKDGSDAWSIKKWELKTHDVPFSPMVQHLAQLLRKLGDIIEEAPPDTGPRRFGNISFRKWYGIVEDRISDLLDESLPPDIFKVKTETNKDATAKTELQAYLLGSFGSSQRLDYGTGHELSLLAFLGCLWKLGAFPQAEPGVQERAIVLGIIEPYLELIRRLILTYTLEPAGSHGVWGLDDHSFLPYIFGSAQLCPAITTPADIPAEGSLPDAPSPPDVAKATVVERERKENMYFSAIGFIYDVKKGPFWEHSPILFDISGVKAGWAKINKGMLKMYNAEVLSKFPVVQHFPFGSLFRWEKDPEAPSIASSVHTSNQPSRAPTPTQARQPSLRDQMRDPMQEMTRAPVGLGSSRMAPVGNTAAPWAVRGARRPGDSVPVPDGPNQPTQAPWASSTPLPPSNGGNTVAPWANKGGSGAPSSTQGPLPSTRAPWAGKQPGNQ